MNIIYYILIKKQACELIVACPDYSLVRSCGSKDMNNAAAFVPRLAGSWFGTQV